MTSFDLRQLLKRPNAIVMGIVNVTPDSFSDGGQFQTRDSALRHALQLAADGADILDVGGESTRPGADPVSLQEEMDRVIPVIESIRSESSTPISIDTYKPKLMRAALQAGADMINDVNALQTDGALEIMAANPVPICLMHKQGQPKDMQDAPVYNNVVSDVLTFFQSRIAACDAVGIPRDDLILDPGIGFGKTLQHNLELLRRVGDLTEESRCPVLIGVSRKSLIGELLGRDIDQRMAASIGLAVQAVLNGAKIVRAHDVRETCDAIRSVEAVLNARATDP